MLMRIKDSGATYEVTEVPFADKYEQKKRLLTPKQQKKISDYINSEAEGGIITSTFVADKDWSGKPHQCIYSRVCRKDPAAAARFFGLYVQEVLIGRPEVWFGFHIEEIGGQEIDGLTYWTKDEVRPKRCRAHPKRSSRKFQESRPPLWREPRPRR